MKNNIRHFIVIILSILLLLPWVVHAASSELSKIQISKGQQGPHIEFQFNQPVRYRVFSLGNPQRLVVDLVKARLGVNLQKIALVDPVIKSVRSGQLNPTTLRLVFELTEPVRFKESVQGKKLVVDVINSKPVAAAVSTTIPMLIKKPVVIDKETDPKTLIVVIDPGHGGKDPGAMGDQGSEEKNVVLAISRRLASLINAESNMRAVLTRDGDYFVPLRGRLKLARKGKADLFIAIHADSYFKDDSSGASVYALSHHGATSEAARWLAQRDNYSELGGVDLGELGDKSYVLRSVLIDLAQTATITDSMRLGACILGSLDNMTKLHYRRVEQAPFMVLKSPDIPSVLVETGFISNPREEEKLNDAEYQQRLADALFKGIKYYLKKYSTVKLS